MRTSISIVVAALLGTACAAGSLRVDLEQQQLLAQTKSSVQHLLGSSSPESHTFSQLRSLQRYSIHNSRQELIELSQPEENLIQTKARSGSQSSVKKLVQLSVGKFAEVPLVNLQDSSYLGTLYLGTPISQPAKLTFDSGSEFLAVMSSLCEAPESPTGKFNPLQMGAKMIGTPPTCPTTAYRLDQTKSLKQWQNSFTQVTYGSAKLGGNMVNDITCLNPVNLTQAANKEEKQKALKNDWCFTMNLIALETSTGLHNTTNGILGLSPRKDPKHNREHILWAMKHSGTIQHAMVSFSISAKNQDSPPYALFGQANYSQVVGGQNGLYTYKSVKNPLGTWAMAASNVYYGNDAIDSEENHDYPGIIDTGSSQVSVPPGLFAKLKALWKKDLPNLECNKGSCQIKDECANVASKIQPVGILLNDRVFSIASDTYLFQGSHNNEPVCWFLIHKTNLPKPYSDVFLVGDVFLFHFYSSYDFDNNTVALGINTHSQGRAYIFKKGENGPPKEQFERPASVKGTYLGVQPQN